MHIPPNAKDLTYVSNEDYETTVVQKGRYFIMEDRVYSCDYAAPQGYYLRLLDKEVSEI